MDYTDLLGPESSRKVSLTVLEGMVFDIKKFSIHDGPGIRTTVFLKGCPLSCAWCHNPESQLASSQLFLRTERCLVCGTCETSCPEGAVFKSSDGYATEASKCKLCGVCVEACPGEARELIGQKMTLWELVEEIKKDQIFYDESGGGVTFSGGEPLMQPDFLLGMLKSCGELDIHRAVDTSGLAEEAVLLEVAEETELFLYDLKHTNPEKHLEFTGISNLMVLSNLRLLAQTDAEISVRVPLVHGLNDDDENIHSTAAFVKSLSKNCEISLLPFHKSAETKHQRFGMKYRLREKGDMPEERVEQVLEIFAGYDLAVRIGG